MSTSPSSPFRELHQSGNPFVLANAWDLGSARMLAAMGAKAIATSSAAHAFTLGLADGGLVGRDAAIAHGVDLNEATSLPVSGDLENGYGHSPDDVAATVTAAAAAGLAGCCIEDTRLPDTAPYERDESIARIAAGVAAARASADDFFLVARADGVMLGTYDLDEAITRVQAFESLGADGVYIPVLSGMDEVKRVCDSVSIPVNVLAVGRLNQHTLAEFGDAGVARVSLGSALASVTQQAILDGASPIFTDGSFTGLAKGADGSLIDEMLS